MISGVSPKPKLQSFLEENLPDSTYHFLFKTIPPERVGLNGEYDYEGLAKRVKLAFCETFGSEDSAHVKVQQRGTVILLSGWVSSDRVLQQFVEVARSINGTSDVEIRSLKVA